MPESRLCWQISTYPQWARRNWNWKLLRTHNLPERVIFDYILWKWIKRCMLFLESLSSPCHSSKSLPWWLLVLMKLPNNKVQMQCWNLMKSNKCLSRQTHGSSVWLVLCECVSCCRSISLRSVRSENWHKNYIFITTALRCSRLRMYLIGGKRKKWLVVQFGMYLEIFLPHLLENSYSGRWGQVSIFRTDSHQCVLYFLITN